MHRKGLAGLGLIAMLSLLNCDQDVVIPSDGLLTLGTWGGDNSGVIVTDEQVHVHVGCTFGDIPGRVEVDQSGRFTVEGSYVLRAYPVQLGPSLPAQFSGRVNGKVLTLAIAINDTVEKEVVSLGPVTVVYGRNPEMGPCPICVTPRTIASSARTGRPASPLPNPE
jgi:hypothetical protein